MPTLRLEIVGPQAAALGQAETKVFGGNGGTIGRSVDNDWVLPDRYISARHAVIHWRNGQYLIEDTSTNGVFINSPDRRLRKGELYALQGDDRIFIDAYEIRVTLNTQSQELDSPFGEPLSAPANRSAAPAHVPDDPFDGLGPFGSALTPRPPSKLIPDDVAFTGLPGSAGSVGPDDADPMKLLGLDGRRQAPSGPRAEDLARRAPLHDHFTPPPHSTAKPLMGQRSEAMTGAPIPDSYDPLSDDLTPQRVDTHAAEAILQPNPGKPTGQSPQSRSMRTGAGAPSDDHSTRGHPVGGSVRADLPGTPFDFASMLAGADLQGVEVTPELAENFGRILRIVVGGLMDVLRTRERIKDEFRMRMTTFKTTDNNPLKFSANVDDALHNLLVKRNSAYLGPAEAFEDAFRDVRNHQMAMLAGVRVAFDAMLSEFEPEHLQERFDRQLKKGSLLAAPARLRYWELYRDKFHDMVKDPESNFRELFGDEFARAYEEQLESLKAAARTQRK